MVDGHVMLDAVLSLGIGACHNSRTVDHDMDGHFETLDFLGCLSRPFECRHVEDEWSKICLRSLLVDLIDRLLKTMI